MQKIRIRFADGEHKFLVPWWRNAVELAFPKLEWEFATAGPKEERERVVKCCSEEHFDIFVTNAVGYGDNVSGIELIEQILVRKPDIAIIFYAGHHFRMKKMTPISRNSGNQHLHRKPKSYRAIARRKLAAYHRFVQLGLIAQDILLALNTTAPERVWGAFGSWFRTIRPGICPSEAVTMMALRNTLPDFLGDSSPVTNIAKFIVHRCARKKPNDLKRVA